METGSGSDAATGDGWTWFAAPHRLWRAALNNFTPASLASIHAAAARVRRRFAARPRTACDNVTERLSSIAAAALVSATQILSRKRKIDVTDTPHLTSTAGRPTKRVRFSSEDTIIPTPPPDPKKRRLDFYIAANSWEPDAHPCLPPRKKHASRIHPDGLLSRPRSHSQPPQKDRMPPETLLGRSGEGEIGNRSGLTNGLSHSGPARRETMRDDFQERARAKLEAKLATQKALADQRTAKTLEEETKRRDRALKKQRLAAKWHDDDRKAKERSFNEAKKEYESYVDSLRVKFDGLGFSGEDLVSVAKRDGHGRLVPIKPLEKKRLLERLPEKWETTVAAALAIRSESSIIGRSVEGVELSRKDLGRLLPGEPWLNDEVVNAWYANLCGRLNEKDGWVKGQNTVPRWVAYSTAWYKNATERGISSIANWSRRKGIKNERLLQTERIFLPTNTGAHWTLLTISGKNKTIEYLDSMNETGYQSLKFIKLARQWLRMELGDKFVENEWEVLRTSSAQQNNTNDCGVFACLNGWALGKGSEDPSGEFSTGEIPLARRMVAAVLMNGGFTGEFDL